ncbi:MAG: DUF1353 domain-containing protein [Niveispirillum sp.]|nr:DUF1353 domain-containing protein [Niveispirillum sp.]
MMITRQQWKDMLAAELGKPYIWGGEGSDGYDCSGFAQWALARLNLDPPGDQTAEGLYRFFSRGRSAVVAPADAGPGDLVFYGQDAGISHIGLAWGNGQMIEAGGGGRTTTSVAIARQQGAEVRLRPISSRTDLVAVLRPTALAWPETEDRFLEIASAGYGRFDGAPPLTEWLDDGRHMRLKRPFSYLEESGREWPVPMDAIVDGASIPKVLWSLIGGPFEGLYRDASIVHDYYCDERSRPWRETHRAFHDAMLCSGVSDARAKIMYYAVYRFGPRWTAGSALSVEGFEAVATPQAMPVSLPANPFEAVDFAAAAQLIVATSPDIAAVEAMADARSARVEDASLPDQPFASLSAEAEAVWARHPLIERLLAIQEVAADPLSTEAAGSMLSRFASLVRDPPTPEKFAEAPPAAAMSGATYDALYATCEIRPERKGEVAWHLRMLLKNRSRYEAVTQRTGVPWWFIGALHALEASFNFNGHLHNGDALSAKTIHVPKGRPKIWSPPNDWESSAVDALTYEGLVGRDDWTVSTALQRWEAYNGTGYLARNINSPYLWSFSNHYTRGKFIKDGVFSVDAVSKQCGAAVMLRALQDSGAIPS